MDGEAQNALVGALGVLNEKERAVLLNLVGYQQSYRMVAKTMGVSARSIQRWKNSALTKLEKALAGEENTLFKPSTSDPTLTPRSRKRRWEGARRGCLSLHSLDLRR